MQKDLWTAEYVKKKDLPSSRTNKPSRALLDFLRDFELPKGKVLDVGSGLGRNSIYLAKHGQTVTGIEIVKEAIDQARLNAEESKVAKKTEFVQLSAGEETWPFADSQFDLVLDMMTMHTLNISERENYVRNVKRVLKPEGYFVFYTLCAESPAAMKLFKTSPGEEENSYVIPQSGIVEKCFTEDELKRMFAPLKTLKLEEVTEYTPAFGDLYERVYLTGVMQK